MEQQGVVLSLHGEVTDSGIDVFDRERVFVETLLPRIVRDFPGLRIVLEHITTREAAAFVRRVARRGSPRRSRRSTSSIRAMRCSPAASGRIFTACRSSSARAHRQALVAAATSGNPRFFLGTDSAPHAKHAKENACGCAGCYSAPAALPLYAEAFEDAGALDRLEGFASRFGAEFYGLPAARDTITLVREAWTVPAEYSVR